MQRPDPRFPGGAPQQMRAPPPPQQQQQHMNRGFADMRLAPPPHAMRGAPRPGVSPQSAPQQHLPQQHLPQQHLPQQAIPQRGTPPQAARPGMPQQGMRPAMPQPGAQQPGMQRTLQPGMPQPGMPQPGRPQPPMQRPLPNVGMRPAPPGYGAPPQPQVQQPLQSQYGVQAQGPPSHQMPQGMRPGPPAQQPMQQSRPMGGAAPLRPTAPNYGAPPQPQSQHPQPGQYGAPPPQQQQQYGSFPTYTQQATGPPVPGKMSMRPMPPGVNSARPAPLRPLPPGAPQNGQSAPAPQNGRYPSQQPPPGMPGVNQQQQQQQTPPAQLPSSAMPRPCATERKCGAPRSYFHRGMIANLDQNASVALIPNSNSDFICVDDGSASLRYMRLTTSAIASDPSVMSKSGVPLAMVLSPFADPAPGEAAVPVVDFSAKESGGGPLRCGKCNAYANPGFKFVSGGSQFHCNLCRATCQTPTEHYSPISPSNGLRMDSDQRHELRYGSVEYVVGSADYLMRPPKPASYVYAIDVSASAISSGLASSAILSIRSALSAGLLPGGKQGARVAIFTFDDSLHFYDARGADEGSSVSVHVVPDVNDPFLPLGGDGFLQTPAQAVIAIDTIVEIHGLDAASAQRKQEQQDAPSASSALGSALHAILIGLNDLGGKAFVVSSSIPSAGIGKLERRGGGAVGGGEDREMGLIKPATPDYEMLGCEMAEKQISVDLFLAPSSVYIDAATLVRIPRACGGRLYMFSSFDRVRDAASLHRSICTATSSVRAFEGLMRVRTSVGLETVGEFIGHFARPQRGDDVSGPVFDATTSTALEMNVVSKLLDGNASSTMNRTYAGAASLFEDACVQCAVLFTDPAGQRRIRVHTMFANKTSVLADVFRLADVDATVAFLAKKAASAVFGNGTLISKAKEALVEKTVQALFVYRKRCTSSSMSGQLILPEALKTLPVTILGLTKSAAFRSSANSMQSSDAVTVDDRVAALAFLVCAQPADIAVMGYPRLWEVQDLEEKAGLPLPLPDPAMVQGVDGSGRDPKQEPIAMPNSVTLMSSVLRDDKILLAENGMRLVVWVGDKVDKQAANDVIAQVSAGHLAVRAETAGSAALLKSVSEKGRRIAAVVGRIVSSRSFLARPEVVVRSAPGTGGEARHLMPLLIEDQAANGAYTYVQFLRHVHKKVMARVANESAQNEMQTWELLNHGY